jgi:hypothetical protein
MLQKYKPGVPRKWLLLLSGIVWSGTGVLLSFFAYRWFPELTYIQIVSAVIVGILLGSVIAYFGFSIVAKKNIKRILDYSGIVCVFAFQEWKSYILIAFMMTMGIYMRTTGIIPKFLLAPMYIGIGLALFLTSFLYYQSFTKEPAG